MEESSPRRSGITIMDGGMGHLLKERGARTPGLNFDDQFLAGVLANAEQPDVVSGIHREYIRAGADVITTNNFVATKHSLGKLGLDGRVVELTEAAARCARRAQIEQGGSVRIAGCLPPLRDSYRVADLACDEMRKQYDGIARVLAPSVDFLLCETMSAVKEAKAAFEVASQTGLPVWVSFSLEDSSKAVLRSGESLRDAIDQIQTIGVPETLLVNCCACQAISAAMPILREFKKQSGLNIGCYGNGFQETTTQWMTGTATPSFEVNPEDYDSGGIITAEAYCRYARQWAEMEATVIGGCCGIGPEHIRALKNTM
ncbi:hypothetical protein BSKO_07594 [Bryopsis sp. KO-2023]|nr:hypothetical protein BSKO_07594 [Bryopsis sp. KO-2023]